MKKVGIIMGSDSDLPIVKKAVDMLKVLEIPFEVHIYSAHRTPAEARDFAVNARANGFGVLTAGLILALMPTGIPVATVAVGGGANAALLAAQILAVSDTALAARLDARRAADAAAVLEKDAAVMEKL